jgi:hypothetical protein
MPQWMNRARKNYGLESLCYDSDSHTYWTVTERPIQGEDELRLLAFDDSLHEAGHCLYHLDEPQRHYLRGVHLLGVSAIVPTIGGHLLVLERELRVPPLKIGSYCVTKLYDVTPRRDGSMIEKRLVGRWKTRMNLIRQNMANYEGMCVVRRESGGRILLLLIADSQNRRSGLMRDWLRLVSLDYQND